jgi:hypothetical protein
MKILVFDLDGTIADLYGFPQWLKELKKSSPTPYVECNPLIDIEKLNTILCELKTVGYKVIVTSWLAKNSSKHYKQDVRQAKKEWLKKYNFPYDEIHLVQYGTTKANCTRHLGGFQILIDDDIKVLKGWHLGATINAKGDIVKALQNLLIAELE